MPGLRLFCLLGLLILGGCSTFSSAPDNAPSPAWTEHQARMQAIDGWQISGKLGIRTPEDSLSGTLFWLQRQDYFDIRLSGPLGQGATRLRGRDGDVSLDLANQGSFKARSPEALLEARTGWRLPVSNLLWWIRGIPAPEARSPEALQRDTSHRLQHLSQAGWEIDYRDYQQVDQDWLPTRIALQGPNLHLTLIIKEWRPRRLGQP